MIYKVFVAGHNLLMRDSKRVVRFGFFATRFVEAASEDIAKCMAIEMIKGDAELSQALLNDPQDPPVFEVEEACEAVEGNPSYPNTGYTFYPSDEGTVVN